MKLAIVCGGRDTVDNNDNKPLQFIENSLENVKDTLEDHGWIVKSLRIDILDNYQTWLANICKDKKVKEFLFFYTGHGISGNRHTQVDFRLRFKSEKATIGDLIDETKKALGGRFPDKMGLVIDSCYSGEAITERTPYKTVEILTSTNDNTKSFEKKGLVKHNPDFGISVFSHYFCQAFNSSHDSNEINLKMIGEFVKSCQGKQKPYYTEALERDKITIGYNHKIHRLKNEIKIHYQNKIADEERQIATFRYDILRYYPRVKEKIYNTIRESTTMDELFMALLKDEKGGYLYCILKFLKIEDDYLINFKGAKKCNEITSKIESVIVVVEGSTNNSNRYTGDIYCGLDNDKVEHYEYIEECAWNELYQIEIKRVLEEILTLNCTSKMELQMVLPIKLMSSEFKNEKVYVGKVEGIPFDEAWGREFNIITKFHSRLKGYVSESDKYFEAWEVNLKRYLNALEDTIGSKSYPLPSIDKVSNFCDNDALFLLSEKSLIDDNPLVQLYVLGVPFMITTQNGKCNFTTHEKYREWKESKVKEIKPSSYRFINELPQELHFLCDDGYSNSFLKAFQNEGEKKEKTFLGDEYE